MKAIVMAGGFAKRLWPMTKDKPKPLLPVGGKPIIEYIMGEIEKVPEVEKVFITTNSRFEEHFREWLRDFHTGKETELVIEPHETEEKKFGAIGALKFLIEQKDIKDDLLIVAGDNFFEFSLEDFVKFFRKKKAPVVAFYDLKDREAASKFGVADLNGKGKIVSFEEKPEKPKSTLVSTGCYLFPKNVLEKISEYLEDGNNRDAPGHFVKWLSGKTRVFGFTFEGKWFDIGSFESLKEADKYCSGKAI